MTLLVTVFAAVISTVLWYRHAPDSKMRVGTLALLYWGAALMWLVDAIIEYAGQGAAFFQPEPAAMLNDLFLGLSAIALGLVAWLVLLLIHDPRGVLRDLLKKS